MRRRLAHEARADATGGDADAAHRTPAPRRQTATHLPAATRPLIATHLPVVMRLHVAARLLVAARRFVPSRSLSCSGFLDASRALAARLLVSCCALGVVAAWASSGAGAQGDAGDGFMRVELPAGREVRVENRLGGVRVELWDEPRVGVAAEVEGGRDADGESPVRIERTENSLSVVVAADVPRAKADAPRARGGRRAEQSARAVRRVDLRLRVPAEARLTIFTASGAVEVFGLPARLDAQTVSGDLRLRLGGDADVMARALAGTITISPGLVAGAERVVRERFNARLGAGSRLVRLSTARGHIELAPLGDDGADAARLPAQTRTRLTSRPAELPTDSRAETQPSRTEVRPELQPSAPRLRPAAPEPAQTPAARRPPTIVGARDAQTASRAPAPSPTPTPEGPIEIDPDEVITVDTHVVTLNLSVVDRQSGRGLSGLTRDDFSVAENGVEQQITHFETTNAPFDLLLLLDLSGSTAKVTEVIRASALRFVESVRAGDRVGVVAFAAAPHVVSELTDDKRLLRSRVATMGAPAGDTKLYDAVAFAVEHLEKNSPKTRRRAVVLMSDGLDSVLPNVQGEGSALSYDEARSRVQEFDGLFYTVWTDNSYEALSPLDVQPETFDLVYDRMEEMAKVGGGLFYEIERLEDLAGAYERVVADLGTVYSVSYLPADKRRDGRWRAVRVRLPRRPEAVARGRSGYFAK